MPAVSGYAFDPSTIGQQPGAGGWWPGAAGVGGATAGGVNYSPTGPGAAGNISQISDLINQINRGAQTQANQARIPQNPQLEAKSSSNISSELQGQLPPDVLALLGENAAQAGVASGSPGNPAAYLRALGLTSLQQQQTGQANLTAADARNPAAPIYNPSQQLITPYESAQLGLEAAGLAGRSTGAGGAAPRGTAAPTGYGTYTGISGPTGPTGFDVYNPGSPTTAEWLTSIGGTQTTPGGPISYSTPSGVPGSGTAMPGGSGVYVDPATGIGYDATTGAPIPDWSAGNYTGSPDYSGAPANATTSTAPIDWSNLNFQSPAPLYTPPGG